MTDITSITANTVTVTFKTGLTVINAEQFAGLQALGLAVRQIAVSARTGRLQCTCETAHEHDFVFADGLWSLFPHGEALREVKL